MILSRSVRSLSAAVSGDLLSSLQNYINDISSKHAYSVYAVLKKGEVFGEPMLYCRDKEVEIVMVTYQTSYCKMVPHISTYLCSDFLALVTTNVNICQSFIVMNYEGMPFCHRGCFLKTHFQVEQIMACVSIVLKYASAHFIPHEPVF